MASYDRAFYDLIRPGVQASAAVVVPLVLNYIKASRTIDVGCGEGWWAHAFAEHGCEVIGVDGGYVQGSLLGDRFLPHDLTQPLPAHLAGRFDLAVCLEVAEHLPAWRADGLIAELCGLAPVVLFSAAIPGQGGVGHVNEQRPSYWVRRFEAYGYAVSGALRWGIWDDPRVEPWYCGNLLLAAAEPGSALHPDYKGPPAGLFDGPASLPHYVVHPTIYDARRR